MTRIAAIVFAAAMTAAAGSNPPSELSKRATQLYLEAHYAEAEPLFRLAIDAWNPAIPEQARNRAIDQRRLGTLLELTGRYRAAEETLAAVLPALAATNAPATETVCALSFLSAASRAQGRFEKAEAWATRALAFAESHDDVSIAERLSVRLMLGSVYLQEHRYEDAERTLTSVLSDGDSATVVAACTNLASVAIAQGDLDRAEDYARRGLRLARLALPAAHPAVATAWNNLGQVLRFRGNYSEAAHAYREAIAIFEASVGPAHPDVAKVRSNLATIETEKAPVCSTFSLCP
jgi:tetratricopeptide (TPR) repeat protein